MIQTWGWVFTRGGKQARAANKVEGMEEIKDWPTYKIQMLTIAF